MYYRTYAKISLSAIKANLDEIRKIIGKDIKVMAIVKADAYGNGANEVTRFLDEEVDYFGVAALEEAVTIRECGVKKPILILSYSSPQQYSELIKYDITQTVYDLANAKALSLAAESVGKRAKVHIKIDTGMSRVGLPDNDGSIDVIKSISSLDGLEVEGIFSHLARADEEDLSFTQVQVERFESFINKLEKSGVHIPIKHLCNSAGTLNVSDKFNMVRLGILLYGMYPDESLKKYDIDLTPSMEIISHVVDVREIEAGVGVSYGHAFVAKEKMKLATVCIGYADGYPRSLSNKGRVIIGGKYAKIVGKVCMDMMMVDVTDIENVKIGDSVMIMGRSDGIEVTAEELASLASTINYEIVCSFKNRVKRVYEK